MLDGTYHEEGASQDAATSSDRRVSPGTTRTGSYQTHGHHYEAFTIQDYARVHTGDVHSSQHTLTIMERRLRTRTQRRSAC